MNKNKAVLLMLAIAMSGCVPGSPHRCHPRNAADRRRRFAAEPANRRWMTAPAAKLREIPALRRWLARSRSRMAAPSI